MQVGFSTESTIRNLNEAQPPPPEFELTTVSPLSSPPRSYPRPNLRPPLIPLYDEENDQSEDNKDDDFMPPLHGDFEGPVGRKSGSDLLDDDEDDDGETLDNDSDESSERPPLVLCGYNIRRCIRKKQCCSQFSSRIVRYAPCFWWMPRSPTGITDWDIFYRLNILCAFFAAVQLGSVIFVLIAFYSKGLADRSEIAGRTESDALQPNMWSMVRVIYLTGVVAVVLFVATMVVLRRRNNINLAGSLRYMWTLLWITPLEIFLVIALFDYHHVSKVWVKEWWYVPTMAWFRKLSCVVGTDRRECTVPICGLPFFGIEAATYPYNGTDSPECISGEASWCLHHYNVTDCRNIREGAQTEIERFWFFFLVLNAIWGALLVILLVLTIKVLEEIITRPIVQKSRESNIPGWLTFPIVLSAVAGTILLFSPSSAIHQGDSNSIHMWIGVTYMLIAGLFFAAACWGWFLSAYTIMNQWDRQIKRIGAIFFIFTLALTLLAVVTVFILSVMFSVNVLDVGLTAVERGAIACSIDTTESCSFCNGRSAEASLVECPEWNDDDVTRVIQSQLKESAALAVIFAIYASSALRFGIVLRRHINRYEIAYA